MSAALRHARELHRFGLRELLWARAFASFPRIGSAVVVTDGERLLLAQRKKTPSRGDEFADARAVGPLKQSNDNLKGLLRGQRPQDFRRPIRHLDSFIV